MLRRAGTPLEDRAMLTSRSYCLANCLEGQISVKWPSATRPRSGRSGCLTITPRFIAWTNKGATGR